MEAEVRKEQVRLLYNNLPLTLLGSASVSVTLAAVLYPDVAPLPILLWCGIILALVALRVGHFVAYRRMELDHAAARRLARQTMMFSATFGLVWAWIPIYYIEPDNILMISNIGLFLVGMVAGALVTQAVI